MSSSDVSSKSVDERLSSLSAGTKFKQAVDNEVKVRVKPSNDVKTARELETGVKDNPFYKILTKADLSNEEKVALIHKVLTYDRTMTKEENLERIGHLTKLEEYLEVQRTGHATQLIDLNGSDVYPQLKNTIGQILDQFGKFQTDLETITGPLKTIEEIRSAGGKEEVLEALRQANESKKLGIELNAQIAALDTESAKIESEKIDKEETAYRLQQTQEVEETKKVRNFLSKMVGGKSHTAMVQREQDIAANEQRATELAADLETKRAALTAQLENLQKLEEILAADPTQKKIQDLIDIGTEDYQKRVDELKDSATMFIRFTSENLDACVKRLKLSGDHIESLETANETYTQYYGLLSQGNKAAMGDNVSFETGLREELKGLEAGNPDDPAVQIKTMEVKQATANVNDFVTKQQSVAETHSVVRNNLAEQQTAIIALKRNNSVALQKAIISKNNGVSTAATHFATVLITINSASTAEATEQMNGTFGAVRKMTQDTLASVLNHLVDDITEGRESIAEQSDGIRVLSGKLAEANENMLAGIKDTLSTLDEADASNRELAEVARKNRAIETDARREHGDGAPTADTAARKGASGADKFGINLG